MRHSNSILDRFKKDLAMFDPHKFAYPTLKTERLTLRGWQPSDLDGFTDLNAHPDFMTYFGNGQPITRVESHRVMCQIVGHWVLRGYGLWVVEETETGKFVGRVGLLQPEGWPSLEVGWGIHPNFWGKGYATEAARASAQWAFTHLECDSLISIIDPRNDPSKAVAIRLGESLDRTEFVKDRECEIFKMTKDHFFSVNKHS
jgi:RimJ/RimL family protein N-acetyltransferase